MYTPKHFEITDRAAQLELIDRHPFGTLMTVSEGALRISTLPFLVMPDRGTLIGHVARANPHWRDFTDASDVAISFVGPNAYISPNWYRSSNMVPTWNYVAIEVRGTIELLDSAEARLDVVDRLSRRHEAGLARPWHSDKMDAALRDKLLDAIVAFEVSISGIDAKLKLGQNRSAEDIRSAAAALMQIEAAPTEHRIAALMLEHTIERVE